MASPPSSPELKSYFECAQSLVLECGDILREAFANQQLIDSHTKNDPWDMVTQYDGLIEDRLVKGILKRWPDHKFIAEESSAESKLIPTLTNSPTWIIDPIDGTTSFIHGFPLVAISVALAIDSRIVIGIIYAPCQNELYSAQLGGGCFLNGKPIKTSTTEKISNALLAYEISLARVEAIREKNMKRLLAFVSTAPGVRALGSAALTLCYVARGIIDGYAIDDLQPWDIAAGSLLVQEAGGKIIKSDGTEYDIMKPDIIASGTNHLCDEILQLIKSVR